MKWCSQDTYEYKAINITRCDKVRQSVTSKSKKHGPITGSDLGRIGLIRACDWSMLFAFALARNTLTHFVISHHRSDTRPCQLSHSQAVVVHPAGAVHQLVSKLEPGHGVRSTARVHVDVHLWVDSGTL
jgi:hypothetical protein